MRRRAYDSENLVFFNQWQHNVFYLDYIKEITPDGILF